jgi:hypothetical protein
MPLRNGARDNDVVIGDLEEATCYDTYIATMRGPTLFSFQAGQSDDAAKRSFYGLPLPHLVW